MLFHNSEHHSKHHHHHNKHKHPIWNPMEDHKVYVMEPLGTTPPYLSQPIVLMNGFEKPATEAPRVQIVEYEPVRVLKGAGYEACNEKVDEEAERFIRLEHKRFESTTSLTMGDSSG